MTTRKINVLPTFHYDVAYLKSYSAYLPTCFANIDEVLRILDKHPDYRFMVEQVILLDEYWKAFPDKRDTLKRHAREGRLDVAPGMWVMPDMNMPDGESLFLQARIGKQWLRDHLDLDPTLCWIADCWGHHAQLPQILTQCGYTHYAFWRCMRRDVMRNDFLWKGIDGTTIQTHWLARGYANLRFPTEAEAVNALELTFAGCSPKEITDLLADLGQYGPVENALVCNGGDFAFPQAGAPKIVEQLNKTAGLPPIAFSTATAALNAIDYSQAPTFDGEFNSALQGTFTSNIRIKQADRMLRNKLKALEALAVVTGKKLKNAEDLWKPILKQQFHDILCGTLCDEALADCHRELKQAEYAIHQTLSKIAPDDNNPDHDAWFNSLSFARNELLLENEKDYAYIELPPLGSAGKVKKIASHKPANLPIRFDAESYIAEIDNRGFITSLITKHDGRNLATTAHRTAFGQIVLQIDNGDLWLNFNCPLSGGSTESALTQNHPDPLDRTNPGVDLVAGTQSSTIKSASIIHNSPDLLIIEQIGNANFWQLKIPFTTRILFSRIHGRIEYQTKLTPTGRHFRLRAAFPTMIRNGQRIDEIPFGLQARQAGEHVAQTFCDYADDQGGLALINNGTPASNVADDSLLLTLFRSVAMEYKAPSTASYNEGVEHTFEYAIYSHGPTEQAMPHIIQNAHAFGQRLLTLSLPTDQLGPSGFAVDQPNVFISALRHHGDSVFIRLYEATGKPTKVNLSVPKNCTGWAPTNGLETATQSDTDINNKMIPLELKPFQILGLLLKMR